MSERKYHTLQETYITTLHDKPISVWAYITPGHCPLNVQKL